MRAGLPKDWRAGAKAGTGSNGAYNDVCVAWPPGKRPIVIASYMSESTAPDDAKAAAHADLLGGGIPAGLCFLQFSNRRAALLVELQNLIQRLIRRREAAIGQPLDEGVLVVANPFDVEQGFGPGAGIEAFL